MRFLLALVGLAAVVIVVMMSLGLLTLQTKGGALPTVHVDGGTAPEFHANVATVSVGVKNKTVDVPKVTTTEKQIAVPTISFDKPANGTSAAQ
jgi:hypothetical protein